MHRNIFFLKQHYADKRSIQPLRLEVILCASRVSLIEAMELMKTYYVEDIITPVERTISVSNKTKDRDLTDRIKTSPRVPLDFPSWNSSVLASCKK